MRGRYLVLTLLVVSILFPASKTVLASGPFIEALVTAGEVHAHGWPAGAEVVLTVDDPRNGVGADFADTLVAGTAAIFILRDFTLQSGFQVSVAGAGKTRDIIVADLTILGENAQNDTVVGTAPPGSQPQVSVDCGPVACAIRYPVVENGRWVADFHTPGARPGERATADITNDMGGSARLEEDDGDATVVGWWIPVRHFRVWLDSNEVHGYNWKPGREVTLTVDDPDTPKNPDYTARQTVSAASKYEDQTVKFILGSEFTLHPGYMVTMTDGYTVKTHQIRSHLTVTAIDTAADTIAGTGDPGDAIGIGYICDSGGCAYRSTIVKQDGTWFLDFGHEGEGDDPSNRYLFDLQPGFGDNVCEGDEDADHTSILWHISDFDAAIFPENDQITIERLDQDMNMTITVFNPNAQSETFKETRFVQGQSTFNLSPKAHLKPGDIVTVTAGLTTRTFTVAGLSIDRIEPTAGTISGSAAPGLDIWVHIEGRSTTRRVTAGTDGHWTADFSKPGSKSHPGEQDTVDLVPGTAGWIDALDSSTTRLRWQVLDVSIRAGVSPVTIPDTFTASAAISSSGWGKPAVAHWDWGDGNASSAPVDDSGSTIASHTYTVPGVYALRVIVTDAAGGWGTSASQDVVVRGPGPKAAGSVTATPLPEPTLTVTTTVPPEALANEPGPTPAVAAQVPEEPRQGTAGEGAAGTSAIQKIGPWILGGLALLLGCLYLARARLARWWHRL